MPTEITIMGYKYSELNDTAKQRVREWHAEGMHDWWDSAYETAKEDGQAKGFDIDDIRFSGFWSQGDGASWTGRVDLPTFIELNLDERSAWYGEDVILLELWRNGWIEGKWLEINVSNYHYCHSGGMRAGDNPDIPLYSLDEDDIAVLAEGVMAGASVVQLHGSFDVGTRVSEWCDEALIQAKAFADDIYKKLEQEYDYLTGDEGVAETCDANEYLFDEHGEML